MSVRKGDRSQGDLEVINRSKELIKYTYERIKDSTFPKSQRWIMPKSIWDNAVGAHTSIIRANSIRVETRPEAEERLLLEKSAIGYLDALISLIDVCNVLGVISDDRAAFWTKLAFDTQVLAKAWLKSQRKNYSSYIEQK